MTELRGFSLTEIGTYVLMDDVVSAIREYAQSLEDPEAGALIHEVAFWLSAGESPPNLQVVDALPLAVETTGEDFICVECGHTHYRDSHCPVCQHEHSVEPPFGAEALDESRDIGRVEIYPDPPEDPRPKWYARSIDTGGYVMQITNGSFDMDWVIRNAEERWPGKEIHLLKNAAEDSKWTEDSTRGVFPSKGPPVRRLWVKA